MSDPLAICIEDLDAESRSGQYVQCVALPGRQPGLRLDAEGRVTWLNEGMAPEALACELCVSLDGRLILYRPEGAAAVTVRREGRSLAAPFGKPVILLDKDEVDVGARRLRIHVHGTAPAIAAPAPLKVPANPLERLVKGAAAAAAVIGAATGCIEVRETPPVVAPFTETPTPTIEVRNFPPTATPHPVTDTPTPTKIEIRETPPLVAAPTDTPAIVAPDMTVTPAPENSVAWALQGQWLFEQNYQQTGGLLPVTGTLTLAGNGYAVVGLSHVERPAAPGTLNFLFDNGRGEIVVTYAEGVTPDAMLADFAPGTLLATIDFRANATFVGSLLIKKGDTGLYFTDLMGKNELWSVTK